MFDIDALIRGLKAPRPIPAHPPAPGSARRRVIHWFTLAAAMSLIALPAAHYVGARGSAAVSPSLELRAVVERDGVAVRIGDDGLAYVGERVYFRAYALVETDVSLVVEGPVRRQTLRRVRALPEGADVRTEGGLLAYEFDVPGAYTFSLDGEAPLALQVR